MRGMRALFRPTSAHHVVDVDLAAPGPGGLVVAGVAALSLPLLVTSSHQNAPPGTTATWEQLRTGRNERESSCDAMEIEVAMKANVMILLNVCNVNVINIVLFLNVG